MVLWPRTDLPAMTLIALARLCVAIADSAHTSINVLAAFVYIITLHYRQVLKAHTIAEKLITEIRVPIVNGGIQPAWPWHHVSDSMLFTIINLEVFLRN